MLAPNITWKYIYGVDGRLSKHRCTAHACLCFLLTLVASVGPQERSRAVAQSALRKRAPPPICIHNTCSQWSVRTVRTPRLTSRNQHCARKAPPSALHPHRLTRMPQNSPRAISITQETTYHLQGISQCSRYQHCMKEAPPPPCSSPG